MSRSRACLRALALLMPVMLLSTMGGAAGAQNGQPVWTTYLNENDVRALAYDGARLWIATSGGAVAYDPATGASTAYHRMRDGLLSDSLSAVAVGSDGRVWLGTERVGISILNPEAGSWEPYTSLLAPIPGNRIERIHIRGDSLLVATTKGFSVVVSGELRLPCQEGVDLCGLPSFDVRDLASDPDGGGLWVATSAGIVECRRNESGVWTYVTHALGPPNPAATRLTRHRGEWVAAFPDGVRVLRDDGGARTWVTLGGGLPVDPGINDLLSGEDALFAAGSSGVWMLPPAGAWTRVGDRAFPASSLLRTPDGALWAGGRDPGEILDGLWRLGSGGDAGTWVRTAFPGPSSRAHYRALAFDARGVLHVSTAHRGIVPMRQSFDGAAWSAPRDLEDWTFDLLFEPNEDLWLAQCCCRESGCNLRLVHDGVSATLDPRNLRDIVYDDEGNLWGASDQALDFEQYAEGIWFRDASTGEWTNIQTTTPGSQMVSNRVRAVLPWNGDLWIGYSDKGVQRWNLGPDGRPRTGDDGTWARYSTETSGRRLISDSVTRIAARGDLIWVGTTAGLSLIDLEADRVTNLGSGADRLPEPDVNTLLLLSDGGAWVATFQGGLTRVTPGSDGDYTFVSYGPPDLPDPNVEALALDPDGRTLWIGTARGLARLVPPLGAAASGGDIFAYPNPYVPGCGEGIRLLGFPGLGDGVIADVSGRIVYRFDRKAPGETVWNGRDSQGRALPPGLYWIQLSSPNGMRSFGVGLGDGPCP